VGHILGEFRFWQKVRVWFWQDPKMGYRGTWIPANIVNERRDEKHGHYVKVQFDPHDERSKLWVRREQIGTLP